MAGYTPYAHASVVWVKQDWNEDYYLMHTDNSLDECGVYEVLDIEEFVERGLDIYWFDMGDFEVHRESAFWARRTQKTHMLDLLRLAAGMDNKHDVCTTYAAKCLGLPARDTITTRQLLQVVLDAYELREVWYINP